MTVDVSRSEYLWLTASQAEALYKATERNDADVFNQEFDQLDDAFAASQKALAQWATPEEIFAPLQQAGIIGVGDMSVAYTKALLEQQQRNGRLTAPEPPVPPAPTFFGELVTGVRGVASMASTILGLVRTAWSITTLDVIVRGFIVNISQKPLTYVLDDGGKNPYLKNCRSVSGPLGTILPGMQQIADPVTGKITLCAAISPWMIANDQGHTGAFAAVLAAMEAPDGYGNPYVGFGWGVPYSEGSRRTIIQPTQTPDAESFFINWDTGHQQPNSMSNVGISNIFTQKDALKRTEGRFLILYRGTPE